MIHVKWHRRSCASFALLNTVFTSVWFPHVSKQCLGICHATFQCLGHCFETACLKMICFQAYCQSVVLLLWSPVFCNWDFSWGTTAWLWMWLLVLDYIFSLFFQFLFFCFFSLMPFSSLLVTLPSISSKSLPLCFAFSPLGDNISADCYHLIIFLICTSAVLQSCCFPADQHSQLGYLNAALLALCWIR